MGLLASIVGYTPRDLLATTATEPTTLPNADGYVQKKHGPIGIRRPKAQRKKPRNQKGRKR